MGAGGGDIEDAGPGLPKKDRPLECVADGNTVTTLGAGRDGHHMHFMLSQ